MVILLDLPFRLLVGSYVVSRMWAIPVLERPSTGLPTPIRATRLQVDRCLGDNMVHVYMGLS
jgi:hypothetical protein